MTFCAKHPQQSAIQTSESREPPVLSLSLSLSRGRVYTRARVSRETSVKPPPQQSQRAREQATAERHHAQLAKLACERDAHAREVTDRLHDEQAVVARLSAYDHDLELRIAALSAELGAEQDKSARVAEAVSHTYSQTTHTAGVFCFCFFEGGDETFSITKLERKTNAISPPAGENRGAPLCRALAAALAIARRARCRAQENIQAARRRPRLSSKPKQRTRVRDTSLNLYQLRLPGAPRAQAGRPPPPPFGHESPSQTNKQKNNRKKQDFRVPAPHRTIPARSAREGCSIVFLLLLPNHAECSSLAKQSWTCTYS